MKSNPIDYLLSTLVLAINLAGAIAFAALASVFLTRSSLGPYHVLADAMLMLLGFGLACVLAARVLLRLRPLGKGQISMTDPRFTAWKLYTVLYEFGSGALKPFTVMFLRPLVQQLFGASIGREIALGGKLVDPHMIRIGDEAIVGEGSVVTGHAIMSGTILLAPVVIGARATIGVGAVIYPGVTVGEGSVVAANAVVRSGTTIPPGETWGGIPARCLRDAGGTEP